MTTVDSTSWLSGYLNAASVSNIGETESEAISSLDSMDFLELFLVQLQNQDPTDPMDTDQISQQLCSYSQLEQQMLTNDYLSQQIQYAQAAENYQATQLVGSTVLTEGDSVELADGRTGSMVYELSDEGSSGVLTIYDEEGSLVKTIELSDLSAGSHTTEWDGTDDEGNQVEDGIYSYLVSVTDSEGSTTDITQYSSYYVTGAMSSSDGTYLETASGQQILYSDVLGTMQA